MELQELSFNTEDVKKAGFVDLNFFASLVSPDEIKYGFPDLFLLVWQLITEGLLKEVGVNRFAIALPRGHGKTTLIKIIVLWCIFYTKRRNILIIGASKEHAARILEDIADMLEEYNVKQVYGDWRGAIETDAVHTKVFTLGAKAIVINAVGFTSSVRGLLRKKARPDFMIFDDAQTPECAADEKQSIEFKRRFYSTMLKLKAKVCTQVYIGNMYPDKLDIKNRYCCLLRALSLDPNWISFVTGAILSDGEALFPEHISKEELIDELRVDLAAGEEDSWFAEVQNDPEARGLKLVDLSKIKKVEPFSQGIPNGSFLIIDPATGKKNGDDQPVTHVNLYGNTPVVENVEIHNTTPKELIKNVVTYALNNQIPVIAVENMGYQSTLLFWFEEYLTAMGIVGITVVPVSPKGQRKNNRILTMFKLLMKQEIWISTKCLAKIENQIGAFNPLIEDNRDDILDTIAYIFQVMHEYKMEIAAMYLTLVMQEREEKASQDQTHNHILAQY